MNYFIFFVEVYSELIHNLIFFRLVEKYRFFAFFVNCVRNGGLFLLSSEFLLSGFTQWLGSVAQVVHLVESGVVIVCGDLLSAEPSAV